MQAVIGPPEAEVEATGLEATAAGLDAGALLLAEVTGEGAALVADGAVELAGVAVLAFLLEHAVSTRATDPAAARTWMGFFTNASTIAKQ
jgi:hypothetical protein